MDNNSFNFNPQYPYAQAENYQLLVETVKDYGIFMLDLQGHIRTWNEGAKNIKGYSESEIIGKHFSIFYPPADITAGKPEFELQEALRVGRFEDEDWRLRKDGSKFWANVIITPLFKEGVLMGFAKVTRDLSERKKLEKDILETKEKLAQSLEETQERLTVALKAAHMGIFDWDIPNDKVFWSDTLLAFWNYTRESFPANTQAVKARIHPADLKRFEEATKNTFQNGEDYDLEYRIIWPDKSIHWIHGRGKAIFSDAGEVKRFTGTGTDITERKRAEERNTLLAKVAIILSSTLDYQQTIRKAAEVIVPSFSDWIIIHLGDKDDIKRFYIYHSDPAKNELALKLQKMNHDPQIHGGIGQAISQRKTVLVSFLTSPQEDVLSTRDAQQIEIIHQLGIASYITTVLQVRGEIIGGVTFIADEQRAPFLENDKEFAEKFTQRMAMAIDSGILYKKAKDAIRVREDVIAIVSHDLKNPINGVLLNSSLILRTLSADDKNGPIKIKLERILNSAKRMQRMIEDILDVTKLEAGTFTIDPQLEDVETMVKEVIELHKSLAEEKSITLEVELKKDCGTINCDQQRILQVLSNLLGNAIKFTTDGGVITLSVSLTQQNIKFSIKDSGPGISSQQVPHIFERYWQVRETQRMGAGLGLFIAKSIVEAHLGEIWVESEEGQGANFIFTLPRW